MTATAPALDERAHFAALDALITAQTGDIVFRPGTAPGDPDNPDETERAKPLLPIFVVLSVERRYAETSRSAGLASRSGWRIGTRYVGSDVDEAAWAAYHCSLALDGARLVIDGRTSTPIRQESEQAIAPDDLDTFSGLSMWIYSF